MLISANNIKNIITTRLSCAPGGLDLCQLANANTYVSNPYTVSTSACLPNASCHTGKFAYVQDECAFTFSNGNSWSTDFQSDIHATDDLIGQIAGRYLIWDFQGLRFMDPLNLTKSTPCLYLDLYCFNNNVTSNPSQKIENWTDYHIGYCNLNFIDENGLLWGMGGNGSNELGTGDSIYRSSPTQIGTKTWKKLSQWYGQSLAIDTDGYLWSWGNNTCGTVGDCTTSARNSPVRVCSNDTTWCKICAGYQDANGGLLTNGTLYIWGRNVCGQIGNNSTTPCCVPVATLGSGYCEFTMGFQTSAAIKTDGTLWTWGRNNNGEMGDGTTLSKSSPTQVCGGGTDWQTVTQGYITTAAIKTDGTLWTWGGSPNNMADSVARSSPATARFASDKRWESLYTNTEPGSNAWYVGINRDGSLWGWGDWSTGAPGFGGGASHNNSSSQCVPFPIGSPQQKWKCAKNSYYGFLGIATKLTGL